MAKRRQDRSVITEDKPTKFNETYKTIVSIGALIALGTAAGSYLMNLNKTREIINIEMKHFEEKKDLIHTIKTNEDELNKLKNELELLNKKLSDYE